MSRSMNIGEAAEATGLSAKMIRHYEQIGLVPGVARTDAGYRLYGDREVSILRFIRQSRSLGFSMAQIAELLGLWSDRHRASRDVRALAQRHVADLQTKLREIAEMKDTLERLVGSCKGDDRPACPILERLAVDGARAPRPAAGAVAAGRGARARTTSTNAARHAAPDAQADPSGHRFLTAWTHAVRQSQADA